MLKNLFKKVSHQFEIVPHVGILPVRLGMTREEVEQVMRTHGHRPSSQCRSNSYGVIDYFIENSFQVSSDLAGRVNFIGISPHPEFSVTLHGKDVFRNDSVTIFRHIQKISGGDYLAYNSNDHLFRDLILTLYDADEQYDRWKERFPVWAEIGIGNEAYLASVDAIDSKYT